MSKNIKIVRITTVPQSLWKIMEGQLAYMNKFYDVFAVSTPGDKLDIVKSREGVKTVGIKMKRGIAPLSDLVSLLQLIKFLRLTKPDIVHTHSPKAGLLGMLAASLSGVKIRLHTVAGMPLESRKGWIRLLLLQMEKLTYSKAHMVFPNSASLKDFILENNLSNPNKVKVLGHGSSNGIDLEHFSSNERLKELGKELRDNLEIGESTVVFGFLGRMVKDKGVNELVRSFKRMKEENDNIALIMGGKFEDHLDPLEPEVRSYIDTSKDIHFLGYIEDVRPMLVMTDVFVFPSHREGLPGALLQAAAMGCAIIAADATGSKDIINNENGILTRIGEEDDIYNAMVSYLNPDIRRIKKSKISQSITEKYDRNYVWECIKREYETQLNNHIN